MHGAPVLQDITHTFFQNVAYSIMFAPELGLEALVELGPCQVESLGKLQLDEKTNLRSILP